MYEAHDTARGNSGIPAGTHFGPESSLDITLTPQTLPQSLIQSVLQTQGDIYRFDTAGSTRKGREELNRRFKSHSDGQANRSLTTAVSRSLVVLPDSESRRAIVLYWSDIVGTPAQLRGHDIKTGLGASAVLAQAMRATIDILLGYTEDGQRIFPFGKSGGDAFDIYSTQQGYEKIVQSVFKGVCEALGLNELEGRFGIAAVTPEQPVSFLLDASQNIIGATGQPFVQGEENERRAEIERVSTYSSLPIEGISGMTEMSVQRSQLRPHTDLAFATFKVCQDELAVDPDINLLPIPTEFKIQLQLERLLSRFKYRLGKIGNIAFDAQSNTYSTYFIPMRTEEVANPRNHLVSMRAFVNHCERAGIKLNLAITNDTIQIFYDENGREIDFGGHVANYLARQAFAIQTRRADYGKTNIVCDERFIKLLEEDGLIVRRITKISAFLRGIGFTDLIDLRNTKLNKHPDKIILDRENTFEELVQYAEDLFRRELPALNYNLAKDIILEHLKIYSGIDGNSEINKTHIARFKTLLLALVPSLSSMDPGDMISRISDTALRHKFYQERLELLRSLNDPLSNQIMEYASSLIFGRNFKCRLKSILDIFSGSEETVNRLIEIGLLKKSEAKGVVYLLPDPILSSYLYTSLSENTKDVNHALIASYLYNESKDKWQKIDTIEGFASLRAFLLHFVYDGKNLSTSKLNAYMRTAVKGLDFMVKQRLYGDYCAVAGSLIKHIETASPNDNYAEDEGITKANQEVVDGVKEYKLMLGYAHARNGNPLMALQLHNELSSEELDSNMKRRVERLLELIKYVNNPNEDATSRLNTILEKTNHNDPDFYHIMEFIIEKFGPSAHFYVLDKIISVKFNAVEAVPNGELKEISILRKAIDANDLDAISVIMRLAWHLSSLIDYSSHPVVIQALQLLEGEQSSPYQKILSRLFRKVLQKGTAKREPSVLTPSIIRILVASGDNRLLEMVLERENQNKKLVDAKHNRRIKKGSKSSQQPNL